MAKLWDSSEDAFCRVQAALDIHIAAAWTKELDAGLQTCQKPFILSICMTPMMMKKAAYEIMYESKPTTRPSFMHKSI